MNHSHCCFCNMFERQVVIPFLKIKSNSEISVEQKENQGRKCVGLGVWWNRMRRALMLLINWETHFHLLILTHWSECIHCDYYNAHKLIKICIGINIWYHIYIMLGKSNIKLANRVFRHHCVCFCWGREAGCDA